MKKISALAIILLTTISVYSQDVFTGAKANAMAPGSEMVRMSRFSVIPDYIRFRNGSEITQQQVLPYLQQNFQKFQQDAQTSMQKKQSDLINPVFAKVGKAIEEVAVENGFAYIINPQMLGGGDVLLYTNEKYNISELVLKKLGVTKVNPPVPPKQNWVVISTLASFRL